MDTYFKEYFWTFHLLVLARVYDLRPALMRLLVVGSTVPAVAAVALVSGITRRRPMIDRSQVDEFAGKWAFFTSAKAARELGYTHLSARDTIRRTVAWIIERGFVSDERRRALQIHPSLAAGSL